MLDRLPVYPSRLAAAAGGGFWLTAFAARTQLVEFVLREPAYRRLSDLPEKPERVSIYLPPERTLALLPEIAAIAPQEVWFNPGAADEAVLAEAQRLGLPAIDGCSIVDLGMSPGQF